MDALIQRRPGVLHRRIRTRAIVSLPDRTDIEIDGIGVAILDVLATPATRNQLRTRIAALTAPPASVDLDDLLDTALATMTDAGLIDHGGSAPTPPVFHPPP